MNEYKKKVLVGVLVAVIFVICIALVIAGQRIIGWKGLGMELLGLAGLLILLWLYNRQYK